jgi:hypothetical protein
MNQKFEITKLVLETMGFPFDQKRIEKTIPTWWQNPRKKENGGLRLTEQGFEALQKADIKFYEIKFDEPLTLTNKLTIWLDQNLDCPYYFTSRKIWVFGERTAVQMVLFSGNIQKYQRAHERFAEKQKSS